MLWWTFIHHLFTLHYFQLSPQEILAIGQKSYSGQSEESIFSNLSITSAKSAAVPLSSLVSSKVLDLSMYSSLVF